MSTASGGLEQVVERCAWCGTRLAPHSQVVIAGGRFAGWSAELDELRGHIVQVRTSHDPATVTAIVPMPDTPAHTAGYDLLFVLCTAACRDALDRAIGDDAMIVSIADARPPQGLRRKRTVKARRAIDATHPSPLGRRPS